MTAQESAYSCGWKNGYEYADKQIELLRAENIGLNERLNEALKQLYHARANPSSQAT